MDTPPQPSIAELNARLAANTARVARYIDRLMPRVDELVAATVAENWPEVKRHSQYLADSGKAYGLPGVARSAEQVCAAMGDEIDPVMVKRKLVRLIGRCGAVRPPKESRR